MNIHLQGTDLQPVTTQNLIVTENIDGLDDNVSVGWGDRPIDSVFVRITYLSVRDIVDLIEKNHFVLDPDFQRDLVWPPIMRSKLIESCIMRIPLPIFYVAEQDDGCIAIVDGLQRISTFKAFLNNGFKLTFGLRGKKFEGDILSGKRYGDLPIRLQERLDDTQLTLCVLDSDAPERAKIEIFERVNSGVQLSRQQMRNALHSGPATKWLGKVVHGSAFLAATGGSLDRRSMRDREAVNRFVSFTLCGWKAYQGDMDAFLAEGLKQLNKLTDSERRKLKVNFESAMKFCYEIFGKHCFRKSMLANSSGISKINISLFDVMSVFFAGNLAVLEKMNKNSVKNRIRELLGDQDFSKSITISTNSKKSVQFRYRGFERIFAPDDKGVE